MKRWMGVPALLSVPALLCAAVLLCAPVSASAQVPQQLDLAVDAASFQFDRHQSYVEVYYAFSRSGVTFHQEDGKFRGDVLMHVAFAHANKGGEPAVKDWNVPMAVDDTAGLKPMRMVGRVNFSFEPGQYNVSVIARDRNNRSMADTLHFPFTVRKYGAMHAEFSDIQLASSLRHIAPDSSNIFYKNTLEVVPNPSSLFGDETPVVYYYAELYHSGDDPYAFKYEVMNAYGITQLTKKYQKSGSDAAVVEAGAVNIAKLPSGIYTLTLSCADTGGAVRASQSKRFYVYNPAVPIDTAAAHAAIESIAAEFAPLNEQELDERFNEAHYISTREERGMWSQLKGAEAKKKFLTRFWRKRDPDPKTPANEFYNQYRARVAYANRAYRTPYKPGWKSDRGRVYILYGPPDAVNRENGGGDGFPYEVWYYDNIEGGVQFVFVDKNNMGYYDLVDSNKSGELQNSNYDYLMNR